jgi:hypothetical protein
VELNQSAESAFLAAFMPPFLLTRSWFKLSVGNNQNDDWPMGANLRVTRLDAAGLKLTISCGRPGTGMPSFEEGAYKLRACYGKPLGDAPDDLYPAPGRLKPDEIDAVIAYLRARIIARGKITRKECVSYYEGYNSELCNDYP